MKLKDLLLNPEYTVLKGSTETEIGRLVCDSRKAEKDCVFV